MAPRGGIIFPEKREKTAEETNSGERKEKGGGKEELKAAVFVLLGRPWLWGKREMKFFAPACYMVIGGGERKKLRKVVGRGEREKKGN